MSTLDRLTPRDAARAERMAARAAVGNEVTSVASYGAGLAAAVERAGYEVVEAARMNARANRGIGKSDPLDAHRIAAAVLPLDVSRLRT